MIRALSFAILAVGAGLALTAVNAQGVRPAPAAAEAADHGMAGGDMKGMMNMMGQMSQMMENCNRMMQAMADGKSDKAPEDKKK